MPGSDRLSSAHGSAISSAKKTTRQNAAAASQRDRHWHVRHPVSRPEAHSPRAHRRRLRRPVRPTWPEDRNGRGRDGEREPRRIGREVFRHAPHGLSDHGDGRELQPVEPAGVGEVKPRHRPERRSATADGRVKPSHAATPPGNPARRVPIAMPSWLLARTRERLAKRDEIGRTRLVEPAPALDVLRGGNSRCARSARRTTSAPAAARRRRPRRPQPEARGHAAAAAAKRTPSGMCAIGIARADSDHAPATRRSMWVRSTSRWGSAHGASRPARSTPRPPALAPTAPTTLLGADPPRTHPNPHQASRNAWRRASRAARRAPRRRSRRGRR